MTLLKCNHAITAIKSLLLDLENAGTIDGQDVHNLLTVLVELRLKNEVIET